MMCTTSLRYRAALVPQAGCTTPTASRGGARLPASFFFMPGAWAICRVLVLVQFSHVLLAACQGSYDEHAVMHASVACAAHICCLRAEGANWNASQVHAGMCARVTLSDRLRRAGCTTHQTAAVPASVGNWCRLLMPWACSTCGLRQTMWLRLWRQALRN